MCPRRGEGCVQPGTYVVGGWCGAVKMGVLAGKGGSGVIRGPIKREKTTKPKKKNFFWGGGTLVPYTRGLAVGFKTLNRIKPKLLGFMCSEFEPRPKKKKKKIAKNCPDRDRTRTSRVETSCSTSYTTHGSSELGYWTRSYVFRF